MRVPMYYFLNGEPHLLGFATVKGNNTVNGDVALPFSPEKVTLDEYHSILCTEKQ